MTTLISVHTSGGHRYRCDARCYNAKNDKCTCHVCGGMNHGVGKERAQMQVRLIVDAILDEARKGDDTVVVTSTMPSDKKHIDLSIRDELPW